MTVVRWTLYDPHVPETWTFEINPNDGGHPQYQKTVATQSTTAPDGRALLFEGLDRPKEIAWKGVILDQAERDKFIHWFNKRSQVLLTNDLGEQYWIYIDKFTPVRKRVLSRVAKYDYDVHSFVVDI